MHGTMKDLANICEYVWSAQYHNIELKFDVTEEHYKWCSLANMESHYLGYYATTEYWYLATQKQLTFLSELVGVVFDGTLPSKETIIA